MAKIKIGERIVEVDDSFMKMNPQDQQSTVDEIEASLSGPATDEPASPKSDFQGQLPRLDLRSASERAGHKAKLAAQSVGQGVVGDLLGLPADFMALLEWGADGALDLARRGVNATAIPLVNKGLEMAEVPGQVPPIPEMTPRDEMRAKINQGAISDLTSWGVNPSLAESVINFHVPGGDEVGNRFGDLAQWAGYEPAQPETSGERLGYNVGRFTSGALTGAGLLRSGAKTAIESGKAIGEIPALARPYAENATRTMVGDAAGGVGAATGLHVVDEYAPESVANNPLVRFLATVVGGVTGSSLPSAVSAPLTTAKNVADTVLPASPALKDPATGLTPSRRTANEAASFVQGKVGDRGQATQSLDEAIRFIEEAGGEMPTSGMASNDVDLRYLEKAAGLTSSPEFAKKYEAVARDAANDVSRLQIEGANKELPRQAALSQIDEQIGAARGNVTAQEGQLRASERQTGTDAEAAVSAETSLADFYRAFLGGADNASMSLDKAVVDETMRPMAKTKNEMFAAIDPNGEQFTSAEPMMDAANNIRSKASSLPPSMKSEVAPDQILKDIEAATSSGADLGIPMMPFKTMTDMRPVLAAKESQARATQQYPLADSYRELKKATGQAADDIAAKGGEAGKRAQAALDNYKDFAPLFAQGEGGKLRKDINTDDLSRSNTPPTKTAGRFLKEGAGGREAAADLQRILAKTPNPAEAKDAARSYVMDSLATTVIGPDGKIKETSLQKWMNSRQGMLSQIPELADEVNGLLNEVRGASANTKSTKAGGEVAVGRMRAELENARRALRQTEADVGRSALSLYVGRDPDRAAAALLASGDPVASVKELKASLKGDAAAEEGLRAAVADNLVNSVTNADGEAVSYSKLASALKKNEPALKEVFGDDVVYLKQAQKRLEMLSRKNVQAVAGSGTIENTGLVAQIKKPYEIISRMMYGALTGGSMTRKFNLMAEQLPDSSKAANDLVKRVVLDPRVAKHLLSVPLQEVGTARWNAKLNRLMGWAAAARASTQSNEDDVADKPEAKQQ